ncbi:MAG: DegV family protein [Desulfopila sp.]
MSTLHESFAAGYSCLSAWSDLLDRINVFPVADSDTGTNLRISLAPLRHTRNAGNVIATQLALCATGNSGNIAAAFFQDFCRAEEPGDLRDKAVSGRNKAWQAISDPCTGTMLSVFDSLATTLATHRALESLYAPLRTAMQQSVLETTHLLPDLKSAGVVDSGALAMYIFFDCFFNHLTGQPSPPVSIFDLFDGRLAIDSTYSPTETDSHCVDARIQPGAKRHSIKDSLSRLGESLVVVENEDAYKIHIHTADPAAMRNRLNALGDVVSWSNEKIVQNDSRHDSLTDNVAALHIVTDAAGSLPKKLARQHNITLLDSYIIMGDNAQPESLCDPEQIYARMRRGEKLTTAQASVFERHQYYKSICAQYGPSLYLCVGTAFTGNYGTAMAWKEANENTEQFNVMDTGAASGRLALIALTTARYARTTASCQDIIAFAEKARTECQEYVFIDELKYLVAGGRLAKTSGFFGDLLHMKPVISPTGEGAQKMGVVRSRKGQLAFALEKLKNNFTSTSQVSIMLQYSDNEQWVSSVVHPCLRELLPQAEIMLAPLSLTSGVHMGPGTWSMAFSPAIQ